MGQRAAAAAAKRAEPTDDRPAVDPESLRALTSEGGEGDSPAATPPSSAPSTVKVLIGGKLHDVSPDVADAMAEDARQLEARRQPVAREPERTILPPSATPQRPPAALAQENWAEFDRQMRDYESYRDLDLERRIEERFTRRTDDQRAADSQREQTDSFLRRIKQGETLLDGEDDIIFGAMRRVVSRNPGKQLDMRDHATAELVTDEALRELARLSDKGKGATERPPRLEGQTTRGTVTRPDPLAARGKGKAPVSIADLQRQRNQARRGRKE